MRFTHNVPHTTPLLDAYLHHFDKVRAFYARPPVPRDWLAQESGRIIYDPDRRVRVSDILQRQNLEFGASPATLQNISRLRTGAAAAVTGQQVGLFGGPLFSLLKALTAARIAEQATRGGVDCVPIFWLATEDHDLAEINQLVVPGLQGELHKIGVSSKGAEHAPVGAVQFGKEIDTSVEDFSQKMMVDGLDVVEILRQSYQPGASFGEAFGHFFARIFRDFGVILLDARDPQLHQIAAPVCMEAIRRAPELNAALLDRGKQLRNAGFHEQVKVTSASTLLFALQKGERTSIHAVSGRFSLGLERFDPAALLAEIESEPGRFSPNVLLRPVVQDFLLPTLAYIGGPSEIAYFAQAAVVYEKLLGRVTPILPRLSVTLVEPAIGKLLRRYQLQVKDCWIGRDALEALVGGRALPVNLQSGFDSAAARVDELMAMITVALRQLDTTLVDAAGRAAAKMRYQLDRLRGRAARAQLLRQEVHQRHAHRLSSALYPQGNLQERVIAGAYFLARYPDLLQTIDRSAAWNCPDHQIIFL